jgi:hypothetical protein
LTRENAALRYDSVTAVPGRPASATRRFQRAVAATDHQHRLAVGTVRRIDQPVDHLGRLSSPGTSSLRGVPRRPMRQQHAARAW